MQLDALGEEVLNRYKNSFDLDVYKNEHRKEWFQKIWTWKNGKEHEHLYFEEIIEQAMQTHPELLEIPVIINESDENSEVIITRTVVNIRKMPSLKSQILFKAKKGASFKYLGEWEGWMKVALDKGSYAFVVKKYTNKNVQ